MNILPVTDPAFQSYGRIISGYDCKALLDTLEAATPLPDEVQYVPLQKELMELPAARALSAGVYGGMPIQLGWCNGHNTKLNCLEYHRDSELNLGSRDFILLVAKRQELVDGRLNTDRVRAFYCPAWVLVELYATTLHYAPCSARKGAGFRVLIVLPLGTNGPKPTVSVQNEEDRCLWACNKWLLAHPESSEAAQGAPALLDGENIDLAAWLS